MKTILMTLLLVVSTQASAFSILEMPSNVDYDAIELYAYNKAVDKAEEFASSKGYSSVEVVALKSKPFSMTSKYLATAGQCQFIVQVGFAFKTKVAKSKNCNNL